MAAAPPKKRSKKEDGNAAEKAMEWFERENKPVTPQYLTNALGSQFSKAVIQKTLEELFSQNKLLVKDIKKVRVYYLRQDSSAMMTEATGGGGGDEAEGTPEELDGAGGPPDPPTPESELDPAEKEVWVQRLCSLYRDIASVESQLVALRRQPTAAERAAEQAALQREVLALEALEAEAVQAEAEAQRRKKVQQEERVARGGLLSPMDGDVDEAEEVELSVYHHYAEAYRRSRQRWRERKEYFYRLHDQALSGEAGVAGTAPVTSEELYDMLGVVTDEMCGVSFKDSALSLPMRYPVIPVRTAV